MFPREDAPWGFASGPRSYEVGVETSAAERAAVSLLGASSSPADLGKKGRHSATLKEKKINVIRLQTKMEWVSDPGMYSAPPTLFYHGTC